MNITIIIPVYKGESTIKKTLDSLLTQNKKFSELIIFNDGSPDNSGDIILKYIKKNKVKNCRLVTHKQPLGLAATYNEGIQLSRNDFVVTLHQDIILFKRSLEQLCEPFETNNSRIVATTHIVLHPEKVWQSYNFWQKVFFSRLVNKNYAGLDGKFDCFRKSVLKKVGMFDNEHFRTAGEDGDIVYKLKKIGRIKQTGAKIIHLHQADNKFSVRDIFKKQGQYSEAQGVMLRLGIISTPKQIFSSFFREFLIIGTLVPYVRFIAFGIILVYSFYYSKMIFFKELKNPRIILIPLINICLLVVSAIYSLKGFIYGKQKV